MTRKETWNKLVELKVVDGEMPFGQWYLWEADLRGANLWGADFGEANLNKANLNKANLWEANLSEANLSEANFRLASLREADLRLANLRGANLSEAGLRRAKLRGAYLRLANLREAKLNKANLRGASLWEADLSEADLSEASLREAKLNKANLRGANLSKADLSEADLEGAIFFNANLSSSNLRNSILTSVNFNKTDLSGADITGAIFWGVSTTGWKIEGIKAEYVYFTNDVDNKEKHKRIFREGQFEALFKSLPTIELIFEGGLSPSELWILNAIIEDIKKQNPELGLELTNTSVDKFQTSVSVKTIKDEFLEKVASLISDAVTKGIPLDTLLPYFVKMLPFQVMDPSVLKPYTQQPITINQDITINLIQGDGSIIQASPHAKIDYSNIINNYQNNKVEIDPLFNDLKNSLHELSESQGKIMQESVDRLIEVLKEGKDIGKAQQIWNEIKEGLKTGGAAASILSTIARFLGI